MDIHYFFPSKHQCYLYDPSGQGNRLDTSFRCTRRTAFGHSTPCSQCCLALPWWVRQSWRCGHQIVTWRKNDVIEVVPKFRHPILIESLFVSNWFGEEEMAWAFFSFHSSLSKRIIPWDEGTSQLRWPNLGRNQSYMVGCGGATGLPIENTTLAPYIPLLAVLGIRNTWQLYFLTSSCWKCRSCSSVELVHLFRDAATGTGRWLQFLLSLHWCHWGGALKG